MNKVFAVLALLCATAIVAAPQTKTLVAKNRVHVSLPGDYPGGIAFPTACDDQGRLYVKPIETGPGMVGSLFRLSNKGVLQAEFDTSGALINRYAVRPDGGVIMMHVEGYFKVVDNFAPDGRREASVQLNRPPIDFFPSQLAVFPSGEILVSGLQYHPSYRASTAIYDPKGRLVKQFVFDEDAAIERAIEAGSTQHTRAQQQNAQAVDQSVAITGDDGLVYLMRARSPATVYAISPAGDVVRKVVVMPPNATGVPHFGARVVKNRLVVQFHRSCSTNIASDACQGSAYAVVDATSGKELAAYEAHGDVAGPIACYAPDPDRFFVFSNRQAFDIVEAEPK